MARRPSTPVNEVEPISSEDIVRKVREWLAKEENVEELRAGFEQADLLAHELTDKTRIPCEEPLRKTLGNALLNGT